MRKEKRERKTQKRTIRRNTSQRNKKRTRTDRITAVPNSVPVVRRIMLPLLSSIWLTSLISLISSMLLVSLNLILVPGVAHRLWSRHCGEIGRPFLQLRASPFGEFNIDSIDNANANVNINVNVWISLQLKVNFVECNLIWFMPVSMSRPRPMPMSMFGFQCQPIQTDLL